LVQEYIAHKVSIFAVWLATVQRRLYVTLKVNRVKPATGNSCNCSNMQIRFMRDRPQCRSVVPPRRLSNMKQIKMVKLPVIVAMSALALSFVTVGCDREISKTESTTVGSDGSVKTKEKTVTESPDGTVKQTETKKTTTPDKP